MCKVLREVGSEEKCLYGKPVRYTPTIKKKIFNFLSLTHLQSVHGIFSVRLVQNARRSVYSKILILESSQKNS